MRFSILSVLFSLLCAGQIAAEPAPAPRWAVAVFPSGTEFRIEVAADPVTRARGYMYREEVPSDQGMLFLFDTTGRHGFWMKNCKVELDIIWLDEKLEVVHIAHEQPPCAADGECPTIAPMQAARYVLEVAGGRAAAEGLETGAQIVVLSEPSIP
ncbi:MAG: DUF192 domain-containing protein [bacterium]|nr:DUF192 domain-containing protein [bacterium]